MTAFFILSGFVLRYAYQGQDILSAESLKNYYLRRFAKIYPPYIVVVLIAYSLFKYSFLHGIVGLPMQLLGLQGNYYSTFSFLINAALWSLSVEIFFYFLFPFFHHLLTLMHRHVPMVMIGAYFLSIYPGVVQVCFGGTQDLYVNPVFRLPEFIAGMCVADLYVRRRPQSRLRGYSSIIVPVCFILILVALGLLKEARFIHEAFFRDNYPYYNFIIVPLIGLIIYHSGFITNRQLLLLTNNPLSLYLGHISYAFYLTQFIAVGYIGLGHHYIDMATLSQTAGFFSILSINLICAIALYEGIEKPVRSWLLARYASRNVLASALT